MLKTLLAHPLTRGLDLDDSRTTQLRNEIIMEKSFLRQIYEEWYKAISAALPAGDGSVLELGSGASFMSDVSHKSFALESETIREVFSEGLQIHRFLVGSKDLPI